jgi:hypothetical protein
MSKLEDPFRPFNLQDLPLGEIEQKYFMEPNGMMFADYKDETCFCSHKMSRHLDCNDICLSSTCICDGFRNAVSEREDQAKIKKKQKTREKETQEDQQAFSYIQTISKL